MSSETAKPQTPFTQAAIGQSGLTLIEVLIAMAIVSIGLLGIAGLQARAIGCNRDARNQTEATALAAGMLQRLRLLPYDHPDLEPGATMHRLMPAGNSAYAVQWTIVEDEPVAGTKTAWVRVGWPGCANGNAVRLRTVIADRLP